MIGFMSYEEIGKELGVTKTAVYQNVKRGINKAYKHLEKTCSDLTPLDILETILLIFNIDNHDDFKQLYRLFSPKIKERIEQSEEWENYKQMQ